MVPTVIYNTHNSFYNRVDEAIVLGEINAAAEAGIELFVLEGGWSGWYPCWTTPMAFISMSAGTPPNRWYSLWGSICILPSCLTGSV